MKRFWYLVQSKKHTWSVVTPLSLLIKITGFIEMSTTTGRIASDRWKWPRSSRKLRAPLNRLWKGIYIYPIIMTESNNHKVCFVYWTRYQNLFTDEDFSLKRFSLMHCLLIVYKPLSLRLWISWTVVFLWFFHFLTLLLILCSSLTILQF